MSQFHNTHTDVERRILACFSSRGRLALFGSTGLDALVINTLECHGHPCIHFDMKGVTSVRDLCVRMTSSLTAYIDKRSRLLRPLIPWRRRLSNELREAGRLLDDWENSDDFVRSATSTRVALRLLYALEAAGNQAPVAVCFAGFHEIRGRLSARHADYILGLLRGQIQRHVRVVYYFTGDDTAALASMFTMYREPFFEGGHLLRVNSPGAADDLLK